MMGSPLQYHSLKVALQHMDANVRFRISLHMPSIREVEKNVPLKIDRLQMGEMITKVNDIEYRVGIVRRWIGRKTPSIVGKDEQENDCSRDYDEFGFPVIPGRNILLPGDISFRGGNGIEERFDTEEHERRSKENLRIGEKALKRLTELASRGMTVEGYLQTLERIPDENDEENRIRRALKRSPTKLRQLCQQNVLQLLSFHCRKNNTKPPFTCYVQMMITDGKTTQSKLFEYTKKLFEASKHLHDVLFGRRTECVQVRNLDLTSVSPSYDVLRLPPAFRVRTHKANVHPNHVSHKSFSLLVENSNSLDGLWIHDSREPDHFQSQAARNAKRLVIVDMEFQGVEDMVPAITDLPNLEITILPWEMWFRPEDYFDIIQAWLARERPIGASCWITINGNDKIAEDVLKLVGAAHERTEKTERCVTILNNGSTKVEVFYDEFVGQGSWYYELSNWMMKTRVVEV